MTKTAYLAFMSDSPLVGLNPQPSWAPAPEIASHDAAGYIEALGASIDRAQLQQEVQEDHDVRLEAVEEGDLDDADEIDDIFEIAVHDDGRIDVIHDNPRYTLVTFTIAQVYQAYGMKMPGK